MPLQPLTRAGEAPPALGMEAKCRALRTARALGQRHHKKIRMDIEQYFNYCRAKKGVTEEFPFDKDTLVFKVGGKMFALASLSEWESGRPSVNLKCDPELAIERRLQYDAVQPGYHMSKVHWNTVALGGDVPDGMLLAMIDESYGLVVKSLTKKARAELDQLGN